MKNYLRLTARVPGYRDPEALEIGEDHYAWIWFFPPNSERFRAWVLLKAALKLEELQYWTGQEIQAEQLAVWEPSGNLPVIGELDMSRGLALVQQEKEAS